MGGYGHIDAINATGMAQVTHVYSSRLLDDDELSARHGGRIKSTVNLKDMFSDPNIDVIDITSYPYQHADQVVATAKAGKTSLLRSR